ncbi:hypothetical protein JTB14_005197 [Gonioctena quinquepunctata]|nr:hypothetical protein JTB14_005197 [Gonioctena quinquepunctata]
MAASTNNQLLNLKPFNGTGFSNWEFRVKLILEQADVLNVLEIDPPTNAAELENFRKSDLKARNIIVQCLSDNMLEMIKSKPTAKEILNALSSTYQKKGISNQVQLQKKLRSLKYTEGTSLNVYLTEFEQVVHELRNAGGKIDQSESVSQLLSSMPETFQAVTTAIDIMFCQDESKVTLDFVKNKLLMEESRQAKVQEESVSSDAAFLGYKKKWNQNWKGKRTQKEKKTTAFPFKCHRCGVVGHKKYECPRTQKSGEKASIAENDENAITFLTSCESSLVSTEHNSKIIKFIIDSGATNHLVNRTTGNFLEETEFVLYKINVAKQGETLEATKQGNLRLKTGNVRKLEESGFQIIFNNNEVAIRKNGALILKGKLQGNLYVISLELSEHGYNTAGTATDDMLMHRRMGHSSHFPAPIICEVCLQGKQTRLPFRTKAYEVPEAKVEVFYPKGFRVSIPDEEGIKLFAFHGNINEEFDGREAGFFARDITKAKGGRWTFNDKITKLKEGDVIYYWTFVDYFDGTNKLGYVKDDQAFVVKELIRNPDSPQIDVRDPPFCESTFTQTTIPKICRGQMIFQDDFTENTLKSSLWVPEQRYADAPDYEFVMYMKRPETIQINNGKLIIKPVLSEDVFGNDFLTSKTGFDFGDDCTSLVGSQLCNRRYDGFLLPPVVSAQVTSRNKFSFKYGKIEVRAKLPKGDWIYPELYLNPLNEIYGPHYESGQIRIAFSPGNLNQNHVLHGGVVLGSNPSARTYGDRTNERRDYWSDDFHTFSVEWKPTSISMGVDNMTYGTIYPPTKGFSDLGTFLKIHSERWKSGTPLAPFDQEMFITIGVGVGGDSFEETNDGTKPWRSRQRNMVKNFYDAKNAWKSTWNENSLLEVDFVKVTAI